MEPRNQEAEVEERSPESALYAVEETAGAGEEAADAGEEPQEQVEQSAEGEEPGGEESSEVESSEEGDIPVTSLTDLAEQIEGGEEFLLSLKVPVKVDGKQTETTLEEMRNSYQTMEAAQQRLETAKETLRTAKEEAEQRTQGTSAALQTAAGMIQVVEQMLVGQDALQKLEELKTQDPTQYLVAKDELQKKVQAVQHIKQKIAQQALQANQPEEPNEEALLQERSKILEAHPDLEKTEEQESLHKFLTDDIGFSDDDLQVSSDSRLWIMAREAQKYRQLMANKDISVNKVREKRSVLKPRASQNDKSPPPESQDPALALYPQYAKK